MNGSLLVYRASKCLVYIEDSQPMVDGNFLSKYKTKNKLTLSKYKNVDYSVIVNSGYITIYVLSNYKWRQIFNMCEQ